MMDEKPCLDMITVDLTGFCNLSCPFCLNDFPKPLDRNRKYMDEKTFEKVLTLLPLVPDGCFYLSCLFEPTLHPDLIGFIKKIPEPYGKKVCLTTNLAKVSEQVIHDLAESHINCINISIDSLEDETFKQLRTGADLYRFMKNLEKLTQYAVASDVSPDIRFITIATKLNYKEIPGLVKKCAEMFKPAGHEIRDFCIPLTKQEWGMKNKLTLSQWVSLDDELSKLPYGCTLDDHIGFFPPNRQADVESPYFREKIKGLRIHADGEVEYLGSDIFIDINRIDDPLYYFKSLIHFIEMDHRKTDELQKVAGLLIKKNITIKAEEEIEYCLDQVFFRSVTVIFMGWCFHKRNKPVNIYLVFPDNKKVKLDYSPLESPDVERSVGELGTKCRFLISVPLAHKYSPIDFEQISIEFKSG